MSFIIFVTTYLQVTCRIVAEFIIITSSYYTRLTYIVDTRQLRIRFSFQIIVKPIMMMYVCTRPRGLSPFLLFIPVMYNSSCAQHLDLQLLNYNQARRSGFPGSAFLLIMTVENETVDIRLQKHDQVQPIRGCKTQ